MSAQMLVKDAAASSPLLGIIEKHLVVLQAWHTANLLKFLTGHLDESGPQVVATQWDNLLDRIEGLDVALPKHKPHHLPAMWLASKSLASTFGHVGNAKSIGPVVHTSTVFLQASR